MQHYTKLYVHIKEGTTFDPHSLVPLHATRTDFIPIGNDAIGVVCARASNARKLMDAEEGVTVLPPTHRPMNAQQAALFAHVGAKEGEDVYSLGERLEQHHGAFWFHPEG